VSCAFDVLAPERLLGPKLIVRSAADTKVLRFVTATKRPWVGVIELEKGARLTTTAVRRDIRATQAIPLKNAPPNRVRDSMRTDVMPVHVLSGLRRPRSLRPGEALFLQVCEQRIDRALDHHSEVAGWVCVTQEIAT
jgi:hypothetical protein